MKPVLLIIIVTLYSSMSMGQQNLLNDSGISYIQIGKCLADSGVTSYNALPDKNKYLVDEGYKYFFSNDNSLIGDSSMFNDVIAATDSAEKVAGIFITVKRSKNFGIEELRQIYGSEQLRSELGIGSQLIHITYYWKTSGGTIFFIDNLIGQELNRIEIFRSERFEERPGIMIRNQE
jgi:hypothetical protein